MQKYIDRTFTVLRQSYFTHCCVFLTTLFITGAVVANNDVHNDDDPTSRDWCQRSFWETTTGKDVPEGWTFENGEIVLETPRKGGNIISKPLPPNFELQWQWKIDTRVNSGLKYRVRRFGKSQFNNNYLGLEYQIIDSKPTDTSLNSTAALYGMESPTEEKSLHPPGEWNTSKIIAVGNHVEHYLNGDLVTHAVTAGPEWDTKVALSKFHGCLEFGSPKDGDRFMLTDHGGRVSYRNFVFHAKDQPSESPPHLSGPFLANGSRNGWVDSTSIVIWTRTTKHPQMNLSGKPFITLTTKEAQALSKQNDPAVLLRKQLPDGASLDEMFGACPGATGRVRLSYFPKGRPNRIEHLSWVQTSAEHDYTAQWKLKDLKPNTKYCTIIEAQTEAGQAASVACGAFHTAPAQHTAAPLTFCVTTCHDFIRRDDDSNGHKIYRAMKRLNPHFVVHAGDIEYYDKPDPWAMTIELMRFKWGRIFALPNNRDFYSHTSTYFIKDDHDTLCNDSWPGQTYGSVSFAEGVHLFNDEQFPSRDPRYAHIRWGRDLEIWLLEGRDYRSPNTMPDGPEKTILGKKQKQWFVDSLQRSDAAFKLVLSPTPIVGPDRENKKDNHANAVFAWEGNELREVLSGISGVIVFCGDRHWQYASTDAKTSLWEFGCGPGSEKHQLGWKQGDVRPVHEFLRVAGGFLTGHLTYAAQTKTPSLEIQHRAVNGDVKSRFLFPRDFAKNNLKN